MIYKLENHKPLLQTKETKTLNCFSVKRLKYPHYTISVNIPKPETRGYLKRMGWAIRDFVEVYEDENDMILGQALSRLIQEKEDLEAKSE